jgi:hypothetical protein
MGKISLLKWIKLTLASVGFKLFIWGQETTKEIYWRQIYEIERALAENVESKYAALQQAPVSNCADIPNYPPMDENIKGLPDVIDE